MINYNEYDYKYSCTGLKIVKSEYKDKLSWNSNSSSLIIATPVGGIEVDDSDSYDTIFGWIDDYFENNESFSKDIIKILTNEKSISSETEYIGIGHNVYIKVVSWLKNQKDYGVDLCSSGMNYMVFGISTIGGEISVFLPKKNDVTFLLECTMVLRCLIESKEKIINISNDKNHNSLVFKYYSLTFYPEFNSVYIDGWAEYEINGFTIPITKKMIDNKVIYVPYEGNMKIKVYSTIKQLQVISK